jgi:hypothetical protein
MRILEFVKAAAIIKLTSDRRLEWLAMGQHVYRGRRKGLWKPALTLPEVKRAREDLESYRASLQEK